jgi:hypothetical protein
MGARARRCRSQRSECSAVGGTTSGEVMVAGGRHLRRIVRQRLASILRLPHRQAAVRGTGVAITRPNAAPVLRRQRSQMRINRSAQPSRANRRSSRRTCDAQSRTIVAGLKGSKSRTATVAAFFRQCSASPGRRDYQTTYGVGRRRRSFALHHAIGTADLHPRPPHPIHPDDQNQDCQAA